MKNDFFENEATFANLVEAMGITSVFLKVKECIFYLMTVRLCLFYALLSFKWKMIFLWVKLFFKCGWSNGNYFCFQKVAQFSIEGCAFVFFCALLRFKRKVNFLKMWLKRWDLFLCLTRCRKTVYCVFCASLSFDRKMHFLLAKLLLKLWLKRWDLLLF